MSRGNVKVPVAKGTSFSMDSSVSDSSSSQEEVVGAGFGDNIPIIKRNLAENTSETMVSSEYFSQAQHPSIWDHTQPQGLVPTDPQMDVSTDCMPDSLNAPEAMTREKEIRIDDAAINASTATAKRTVLRKTKRVKNVDSRKRLQTKRAREDAYDASMTLDDTDIFDEEELYADNGPLLSLRSSKKSCSSKDQDLQLCNKVANRGSLQKNKKIKQAVNKEVSKDDEEDADSVGHGEIVTEGVKQKELKPVKTPKRSKKNSTTSTSVAANKNNKNNVSGNSRYIHYRGDNHNKKNPNPVVKKTKVVHEEHESDSMLSEDNDSEGDVVEEIQDDSRNIGNKELQMKIVDNDPLCFVGKEFHMLEDSKVVSGVVTQLLSDKKKILWYRVEYKEDDTYDLIQKADMQQLMLNGRNGTMFTGTQSLSILNGVRAWKLKNGQVKLGKKYGPDDCLFELKWGASTYKYQAYNHTMFFNDHMQAFLYLHKKELNFSAFRKHHNSLIDDEMSEYRYVPASSDVAAFIKLRNKLQRTKSMSLKEAEAVFGKLGIARIVLQYEQLPSRGSQDTWFFIDTGLPTSKGGSLVQCTRSVASMTADIFHWLGVPECKWHKSQIMKIDSGHCYLTAALNSSSFTDQECENLFCQFKNDHDLYGQISIGYLSKQLEMIRHAQFRFKFFNYSTSKKSFLQLSLTLESMSKQNVAVVCYLTNNGTTHCISWDAVNHRILDPDVRNVSVFCYDHFNVRSKKTVDVMNCLQTNIETPCILSVGFWQPKYIRKRKKRKFGIEDHDQR